MNVVLVGYRGTGKTAWQQVGPTPGADSYLAGRRDRAESRQVDSRYRFGTGLARFSRSGRRGGADASAGDGLVIDCGGGVVEREANFPVLRGWPGDLAERFPPPSCSESKAILNAPR